MANTKKKIVKNAPASPKTNQGIYGLNASKSSIKIIPGSELTGTVK
jgi:hypothetical protein